MRRFYQEYLSPEIVSRLSRLDLIAKYVVEGYITGLHKSPYHGFSTEFAEHRQYMPGDSLRYLDWKVFGRTDRMYVKRFEEETNLKSHIILDVSGSMAFKSRGPVTKLRYGTILAAALSFLMIRQRDSIGIVTSLNPYIGYENSTRIAKKALEENRRVIDLVREEKLLSEDQIKDILKPEHMTRPRRFS